MKLSDKEMEAITQIANHKLLACYPKHNPNLFGEPYVWNDGKTDGCVVSLQDRNGNLTQPVAVLNSEIKSAIKFLDTLERAKDNPVVAKAFEMSPENELHALRLAVVGLVKAIEFLRNSQQH